MENNNKNWSLIIQPQNAWFDLKLNEVWRYRDLLLMLVRRDIVAQYKQTILGPLWYFIQPILTTITFYFIFGKVANTSPGGVPQFLFYMAGVTCWNYFSESLTKTSNTFTENAGVFGKVYFPRIIVPLSVVVSNLIRFGIQLLLFFVVLVYTIATTDFMPNWQPLYLLLFPVIVLMMALLGLGLGAIISSLTTKYRDLRFLIQFGVQLFMYATPVVYPLSLSKLPEQFKVFLEYNPMTAILETFRFLFLGHGIVEFGSFMYSFVVILLLFFAGVVVFNKVEKNFMDTV